MNGDNLNLPVAMVYVQALNDMIPPAAVTAEECPGAIGSTCTVQCQLRICQALSGLYTASNNVSDPWDNEQGWDSLKSQPCQQLVNRRPAQRPAYCSWHGVICCSTAHVAQQRCNLLHSVLGLNLMVNNLNVSLEDPRLFRSLKTLHDCGMFMLNMENNNVIGRLTSQWGQLERMQYLNLGKDQLPARYAWQVLHVYRDMLLGRSCCLECSMR